MVSIGFTEWVADPFEVPMILDTSPRMEWFINSSFSRFTISSFWNFFLVVAAIIQLEKPTVPSWVTLFRPIDAAHI